MTSPKKNRQNYIPQHFQQRIQEAKNKKLKKLDLSGSYSNRGNAKLAEYPDDIWELEQLAEVLDDIWELEQLEVLNLSRNKLQNFLESISRLCNLIELDLSDNQLTDIPESISKLSNLTELDLNGNQLKTIPESIFQLTNLTKLGCKHSAISIQHSAFQKNQATTSPLL